MYQIPPYPENCRPVPGFEAIFAVSCQGDIWSLRSQKFIKFSSKAGDYPALVTQIGGRLGKAVMLKAHRAVALAWVPNPENKPYINHKDGNKQNFHCGNLEWVTARENSAHARDTGLQVFPTGLRSRQSRITPAQLEFIRTATLSHAKIGAEVGLSRPAVTKIRSGQTYKFD